MQLYPFHDCAERAQEHVMKGASVFQQWLCEHCNTKQTMQEENKFWTKGECEECKKITDIQKNGCNYMLLRSFP